MGGRCSSLCSLPWKPPHAERAHSGISLKTLCHPVSTRGIPHSARTAAVALVCHTGCQRCSIWAKVWVVWKDVCVTRCFVPCIRCKLSKPNCLTFFACCIGNAQTSLYSLVHPPLPLETRSLGQTGTKMLHVSVQAVQSAVACFDVSSFAKFHIEGEVCCAWQLSWAVSHTKLSKPKNPFYCFRMPKQC